MSHTILLVQPGTKPETRTYSDYESVNECMEGVCKIYEEHLKRQNPSIPSITYDISQLFDFIDQLSGGKNNLLTIYVHNVNSGKVWVVRGQTRVNKKQECGGRGKL